MKKIVKLIFIFSIAMNIAFVIYFLNFSKISQVDLGLNSIQLDEVGKIRNKYVKENRLLKDKIKVCQKKLINSLDKDVVSREEAYKCIKDINSLQEQIQKNCVDEIISVKEQLTKKQCKCLIAEVSRGMGNKKKCGCGNRKHNMKIK